MDDLRDDVLYLVRKDVWEERKKKATHVALKVEDETPAEKPEPTHVELNFD